MSGTKDFHRYKIEILYHYNCYGCLKWWSVAGIKPATTITCPHCGREAMTSEESKRYL